MKAFFATARLCVRNSGEFGLMNTLGEYLLKLIALAAQWMVWRAILPEGATVDGMTRQGMLVYVTVSSALAPMLDVRTPASSWLHDGTMLGLFQRPRSVFAQLAAHTVGGWLVPLLLYGLPLLALSSLLGFAPVPRSPWFFPSLMLCVGQGFAVDYLFACLQIHKSEYLRGYGSADIGAENDADRLAECKESRSNQTNSQYYSRGRTLYHTCDQKPKDESHDRFVGHFGKSRFHGAAGTALQSVAHEPHSVQEQSKSA